MTLFIDLLMKTTVLIAVGAVVGVALHRASAAARHVSWTLVAVGCLLLPVMMTVLPEWRLDALPDLRPAALTRPIVEVETSTANRPVAEPADAGGVVVENEIPLDRTTSASGTESRAAGIDVPWYVWLWAAGALAVLIVFATGARQLNGIARRARPLDDPDWRTDAADIAGRTGLDPAGFRLMRGEAGTTPMTWGVLRPVVVLPSDCIDWPEEQRREVLLHELAHVRRRDILTQWLANLACVVYWCHPLVWWTARRMLVERERACDDRVIRGGAQPSGYAKHLLEIARTVGAERSLAPAGVSMARRSQVSGRLLQVLDPACNRGQPRRGHVLTAAVLAVAVLLPVAAVQPGRVAHAAPVGLMSETWDPSEDVSSRGAVRSASDWRLQDIRAYIDARNEEVVRAVDDRDPDAAADLYSRDVVFYGIGGGVKHGRSGAFDVYRKVLDDGYRKLTVDSRELRRLQDDLVHELGVFVYVHRDGVTKLSGRYMSVWRYENGRWVIYREMSNI